MVDVAPESLITMYVCGITPYAAAHIGHALTYITFDILHRRFVDSGNHIRYIRNVTDIDDPLFERARETHDDWRELGSRELSSFTENMEALDLRRPDAEVRVTDAIPVIQRDIEQLVKKNQAYVVGDSVYFSAPSVSNFGEVSHLLHAEMIEVAARRGGNVDDPNKRNPLDVVLWQPSADDEPRWESPWGSGRPGWHIECTAIIHETIGQHVLIHGGGADLQFPHHECENAISRALWGTPLADVWMHVALLSYQGEKMSKSLGNLVFVRDLLRDHEASLIRLALLQHHYREEWEWDGATLERAVRQLETWRTAEGADDTHVLESVRHCIDDDLDVPQAITLMTDAASAGHDVSQSAALLGISL